MMWRPKLGIPLVAIVLGVLWMSGGTSGQTPQSQARLKADTTRLSMIPRDTAA